MKRESDFLALSTDLHLSVRNLPLGTMIVDKDGDLEDCNSAALYFLGVRKFSDYILNTCLYESNRGVLKDILRKYEEDLCLNSIMVTKHLNSMVGQRLTRCSVGKICESERKYIIQFIEFP